MTATPPAPPIRKIDRPVQCACLCGARDEIAMGQPIPPCWLCGGKMTVYGWRKI